MGVGLFLIFCVQIRANALKNEANTMGIDLFDILRPIRTNAPKNEANTLGVFIFMARTKIGPYYKKNRGSAWGKGHLTFCV